jgi:hypothetical protein
MISVLAVWNCTTTQPDSITTRNASLSVSVTALLDLYNCYERWRDVNSDGLIDATNDEFQGMQCDPAPGTTKTHRPVPWHYSLSVSLIRAGTTTEEIAVSTSGVIGSSVQPRENPLIPDYISMTGYDPDMPPVGDTNIGNIYLINGKTVTPGSPVYLSANGFNLGEPNLLGEFGASGAAPTFDFSMNSGDTVIVRARKQPFSLTEPFMPLSVDSEVAFSAVLAVGGVQVSTSPGSPVTSTFDDGAGITFSFTVQ